MTLLDRFGARLRMTSLEFRDVILAISRVPYGRNSEPSADAVVAQWRGTCSTKHLLLRAIVEEHWPSRRVELWHRAYIVTKDLAASLWGKDVAAVVPERGLTDVHTFATVDTDGMKTRIDVTAPLTDWDGCTDTPLQCGPGKDVAAGPDPLATKRILVERFCDARVREPFIAAVTASLAAARRKGA